MPRRGSGGGSDAAGQSKYPELARVLGVLMRDVRGGEVASRVVQRRTGVNFTTVLSMRAGNRGDLRATIRVARGYRINPNRLLAMSDHDEQPEFDLVRWDGETPQLMAELGWESRPVPTDLPLAFDLPPAASVEHAQGDGGRPEKRIVFRTGEYVVVEREQGGEPVEGDVDPELAGMVYTWMKGRQAIRRLEEGGEGV